MKPRFVLAGASLLIAVVACRRHGNSEHRAAEVSARRQTAPIPIASMAAKQSSGSVATGTGAGLPSTALPTPRQVALSADFVDRLTAMADKDPAEAARLAESLEPGMVRQEVIRFVAELWAARDPQAAANWAYGLGDSGERELAFTHVCEQTCRTDGPLAIQLAGQRGALGAALVPSLAQAWAGRDVAGATAWAVQQPASEQRDQILTRVAYVAAQTSPAQAAQLVVSQISPGPTQIEAAMSVLSLWARQDLTGARAWVSGFPAGELKDRALTEIETMARHDNAPLP
jgi:hypothetical protein